MTGREWRPGDVALIEVGCHANRHVGIFIGRGWRYADDKWVDNDPAIVTARPVVTLDLTAAPFADFANLFPEWLRDLAQKDPAVQLERAKVARWLADQIEAQTRPPRPPEPTGLGAVVEASCHCSSERRPFVYEPLTVEFEGRPRRDVPWKADCGHHPWDRLTDPKVLSEGWSE